MLDLIVTIEGHNKITWSNELLLVPGFDKMSELKWNAREGDKDGRNRYYRDKVIKYIVLVYKYNSPLSEMSFEHRVKNALRYAGLPDDWQPDEPRVKEAIKEFVKLNSNVREIVMLDDSIANIDAALAHIRSVDYNKVDENGKLVYDVSKYLRASNEFLATKDNYIRCKKELMQSLKSGGAAGNRAKKMFEDPNNK